jgi:DNA (cytosine-5)-methyltransferase 1
MIRYGSICSGIEAATVAWHPLGWKAQFFAEIAPFPCSVLKHHYPNVPNYGDFTTIDRHAGPIDVLVGGTPCQSFSVAGKRAGLDDPRGNLTLEFLALAGRLKPRWVVWENVPGVLSDDGGRTFGTVLGMLGQLGYGFAYRILDAQYFGVPQRRRRVFVVGCLGSWHCAAAVLFESESLRGYPAPSREAGERIAPTLEGRAGRSGGNNFATSGRLEVSCANVAPTLNTSWCKRSAGSTAQEWDSEKGARFIVAPTLRASKNATGGDRPPGTDVDTCESLGSAVRRLTPGECEALQGFLRGYTKVPYRGKPAADGPRYAAIGNSMAVPVMRWIGERIQVIHEATNSSQLEQMSA